MITSTSIASRRSRRRIRPRSAQKIADRHFGVGGDGLILICPSEKADARMVMFNADGSEAEMCGNGVRCVAKYVHDHGIAQKPTLTIETGNGVLTLEVAVRGGKVEQVRVDMGEPILDAAKIPTTLPGNPPIDVPLPDFGLKATCVSMGNPHCVIFVDEITQEQVHGIGPQHREGRRSFRARPTSNSSGSIAATMSPCASGSAAPAKRWRAAPGHPRSASPAC